MKIILFMLKCFKNKTLAINRLTLHRDKKP